ncbi:sulfite exporter TauE/SafE family protein [Reinekea blandensis]|uniref:Urease accessory protein UreH-like transmembrane domain-containing protein n=1 Tax=Reinekea blandensis MED297 TaxID=314283 RepID=A4BCL7_9GAMM|nr:sulfite exporter TauE/SafE family protein [Reinekea blandensis]EAR10283.1 hypothetical protein MED297_13707 [Reinekea sp. MED297] [Reinekea blandensis MED297]
MLTEYSAAFLLGLVSAGHCLGMCGGIVLAAGLQAKSAAYSILYNIGRIGSYATLALIFGSLASMLPEQTFPAMKLISSLLLVLTALYLSGLSHLITRIEVIGKPIWALSQPVAKRLMPVRHPGTALLLGYFWGFIPCGLVYTALTFSLAQPTVGQSMISMLSFGLGTFPAMIGATLLATTLRAWLAKSAIRWLLAGMMIIMALIIFHDAVSSIMR